FNSARLDHADLAESDCEQASFQASDLSSADLTGANFSRAQLSSSILNDANISGTNFFEATLDRARMRHIRGAPAALHLLSPFIQHPVSYFETAVVHPVDRWLDWQRVRIAGRLPFFAVSYSALAAIPFFFYVLEIYNDKVDLVRAWASRELSTGGL